MTICKRCYKETLTTIMSTFDTDIICLESFFFLANYERAREAEINEVRKRNYNFGDIGFPKRINEK
jgi:hypothetical protein